MRKTDYGIQRRFCMGNCNQFLLDRRCCKRRRKGRTYLGCLYKRTGTRVWRSYRRNCLWSLSQISRRCKNDVISLDGKVHDPNRIGFLARYLHELKRADSEIDLRGYFQWSLMDNFEWSEGYAQRFGLVYVDFRNQQRILKDSAYWYRDVIRENGNNL